MIRNTRANAGLNLPPRRAETVLFEPATPNASFWQQWEAEFRAALANLSPVRPACGAGCCCRRPAAALRRGATLWGSFPNRTAARAWRERAPLEASWRRKCELIPPLDSRRRRRGHLHSIPSDAKRLGRAPAGGRRGDLRHQRRNARRRSASRSPRNSANAAARCLLTHSGTEGRNLQFCHRLANFDLPWNPMEIEQRIGRLHRLGQQHPVRIYNFVQAGTLQEHLLQILQEKLNLFELVVGETGLVLGERFSSDEFAEEVLRRWRESEGRVAEALAGSGRGTGRRRATPTAKSSNWMKPCSRRTMNRFKIRGRSGSVRVSSRLMKLERLSY